MSQGKDCASQWAGRTAEKKRYWQSKSFFKGVIIGSGGYSENQ